MEDDSPSGSSYIFGYTSDSVCDGCYYEKKAVR